MPPHMSENLGAKRLLQSDAAAAAAAKSLQSCLNLFDAIDSSPPGFSVHRILQARVLEWVAISICDQIKNSNNSFLLNVEVILKVNVNTQKKPT